MKNVPVFVDWSKVNAMKFHSFKILLRNSRDLNHIEKYEIKAILS